MFEEWLLPAEDVYSPLRQSQVQGAGREQGREQEWERKQEQEQ
jgi:hypothetical protein